LLTFGNESTHSDVLNIVPEQENEHLLDIEEPLVEQFQASPVKFNRQDSGNVSESPFI